MSQAWISPNERVKNKIDHILINERWKYSLHDIIVRRVADVGRDQPFLLATIKLQLIQMKSYQDSNLDEEAERDVETAWEIAKESYSCISESVLGKNRK